MYSYAPMSDTEDLDRAIHEVAMDLEMEEQQRKRQRDLQSEEIQRIVRHHLGETTQNDITHQIASSSSSNRVLVKDISTPAPSRENSIVPMIVNKEGEQQKRERSPETSVEPRGRRGNPRRRSTSIQPISYAPEDAIERRRRARTRSPSKTTSQSTTLQTIAKPKARGRPPKPLDDTTQSQAISEPKAKAQPKAKQKPHGVDIIESKDRKFWEKQNASVLKVQAELRGNRFTDTETKGGQKVVKGVIQTVNKFKKKDYFQVLMKILKI